MQYTSQTKDPLDLFFPSYMKPSNLLSHSSICSRPYILSGSSEQDQQQPLHPIVGNIEIKSKLHKNRGLGKKDLTQEKKQF